MAEERKQLGRRWLWVGAAVVVIAVFFMARSLLRDRLPVRAAQAEHEVLLSTVSTNGKVEVEPEANYQFYSPIATTVKKVFVQTGDHVPAGKLMIVLDDMDARAKVAAAENGVKTAQALLDATLHNGTQEERLATQAEINRAQLTRDQAQHNLEALTKLAASGAASSGEVAAARQQLESANASLNASQQSSTHRYSPGEVARSQSALAEAEANLAAARQIEAQTQIHAPVAGTVYSMDATPTSFAEAGKLLLQMGDLKRERVRAYFDEPDLGRLAVGQKITIKWDAKPGQEWHGHIVRLPVTVVTYATRTVGEVLVQIDDADSGLLPDTNVNVTVTTATAPDALSVPREALHFENGKPYVYRISGDQLVRTPVTTGVFNLTREAILSGLKEGDWVATGSMNGQQLQEGVPIKVVR
ncbi:MAG TPA: efflux RND transporter periplasmic adaptor subunit [Terracidiphilus sp.]|nr:efflux RND transporter periplasmic adaptor subunit [Terracidiphilus sp.]